MIASVYAWRGFFRLLRYASNITQVGSILTYEKENDDSHIQRHGRAEG